MSRRDNESYDEYIVRLQVNPIAVRVKLNDLTDNMDIRRWNEVQYHDLARLQKYLEAYKLLTEQEQKPTDKGRPITPDRPVNHYKENKVAGIYIHIPYCKTRCTYCDFYTLTNESQIDAFVNALCGEAEARKEELSETVKTIYFGGGTPSRLHQHHFEQLFDTLFNRYTIDANAEITVEANPDDLSDDYIRMLAKLPVNRLSIGIQSFDDEELKFLSGGILPDRPSRQSEGVRSRVFAISASI